MQFQAVATRPVKPRFLASTARYHSRSKNTAVDLSFCYLLQQPQPSSFETIKYTGSVMKEPPSPEQWERHRPLIEDMYEWLPLNDIKTHFKVVYGFDAS